MRFCRFRPVELPIGVTSRSETAKNPRKRRAPFGLGRGMAWDRPGGVSGYPKGSHVTPPNRPQTIPCSQRGSRNLSERGLTNKAFVHAHTIAYRGKSSTPRLREKCFSTTPVRSSQSSVGARISGDFFWGGEWSALGEKMAAGILTFMAQCHPGGWLWRGGRRLRRAVRWRFGNGSRRTGGGSAVGFWR